MGQASRTVGFLGAAFVVYVTAKGELPLYLSFFRIGKQTAPSAAPKTGAASSSVSNSSGITGDELSNAFDSVTGLSDAENTDEDSGESVLADYGNSTPTATELLTALAKTAQSDYTASEKTQQQIASDSDNVSKQSTSQTNWQKAIVSAINSLAGSGIL